MRVSGVTLHRSHVPEDEEMCLVCPRSFMTELEVRSSVIQAVGETQVASALVDSETADVRICGVHFDPVPEDGWITLRFFRIPNCALRELSKMCGARRTLRLVVSDDVDATTFTLASGVAGMESAPSMVL